MRSLTILVWLTLVWVTLWEALTWANVLGGVLVATFVLYLLPPRRREVSVGFRPLAALRLLGYFLLELVVASAQIVREVLTPRDHTKPAVVSAQLRSNVPGHATAVANMISLTPGTLTLDIDGDTMTIYIHVLHLDSFEETRAAVRKFEDLTIGAFPTRSDVASGTGAVS